jgi:hypothetical protein
MILREVFRQTSGIANHNFLQLVYDLFSEICLSFPQLQQIFYPRPDPR